jgi:CubicO group peptidase (beta-lactamase class C family)
MARFGLLILNKGNWNGNQVMTDTNYFNAMLNTSQALNLSYGYLWWLNGKSSYMLPQTQFVFNGKLFPHAPNDVVAAMGKNGQFLNVCKSQNLVWLRMGESPDSTDVPFLLNDKIWEYIQLLPCNATAIETPKSSKPVIIYPNPGSTEFQIESQHAIDRVHVFTINGERFLIETPQQSTWKCNTLNWSSGLYRITLDFKNAPSQTMHWLKQ